MPHLCSSSVVERPAGTTPRLLSTRAPSGHAPTGWLARGNVLALLTGALLAGTAPAIAQAPADLRTRAELTGYAETSSYSDVVGFLEAVSAAHPDIQLTTYGYTSEARPLPLAIVGRGVQATPESVRSSGKTVLYLQGNIHGGEVPGKEALQMLLREIANGEHDAWLDDLVLLVAPIYNADGNERMALTNRPRQHGPIGGMGQRPNAQGYDLNRDHMKLDSPEARSVARLMTEYDPHVAVDLHTTNGTRHAYHLTYSPPLHPNTPAAIDALLRDELFPTVTDRVRDAHGWEFYYYGNASTRGGTEMGWYTFDHRPRFNNNYIGLRNRIAILGEAYSYATFEDRVLASLWLTEEIVDFVAADPARIRQIVADADAEALIGQSLATRAEFVRSGERVDILMGEVDEELHPLTGRLMLRRRDVQTVVPMYEYGTAEGTEFETVPAGYVVPGDLDEVIVRLVAHGVRTVPLETESIEGEVFRLTAVETSERAFQGHNEQTLSGSYEPGRSRYRRGASGSRWTSRSPDWPFRCSSLAQTTDSRTGASWPTGWTWAASTPSRERTGCRRESRSRETGLGRPRQRAYEGSLRRVRTRSLDERIPTRGPYEDSLREVLREGSAGTCPEGGHKGIGRMTASARSKQTSP